jgi:hypothetical protein
VEKGKEFNFEHTSREKGNWSLVLTAVDSKHGHIVTCVHVFLNSPSHGAHRYGSRPCGRANYPSSRLVDTRPSNPSHAYYLLLSLDCFHQQTGVKTQKRGGPCYHRVSHCRLAPCFDTKYYRTITCQSAPRESGVPVSRLPVWQRTGTT